MVSYLSNGFMEIQDQRRANLQAYIDQHHNGSVAAFAKEVHKSETQMRDMLAGRKPFGEKIARDLERRAKHLTLLALDAGSDATLSVALNETRSGYVRFALLEGFAGMGRGDYVGNYPEIVDWVEVTREWARQKLRGVDLDQVRVITGRGDSMRGQYNDGDLIFVDSSVKQFVGDSAYCYRWDGQVQIKRLQVVGGGRVRILSKNPDYPPVEVDLAELEIGGRALAAWTLQEF